MKKKTLFVTNNDRLQPTIREMESTGRYDVTLTPSDELAAVLARETPSIVFLDMGSICAKFDDLFKLLSHFDLEPGTTAQRLYVLDPLDFEREMLEGCFGFITSPHTSEKLIAQIERTWGSATEQPFSFQFTLAEGQERSVSYHVKERRLHFASRVGGKLEHEYRCAPTNAQWREILRVCHEVDVKSFPQLDDDCTAKDGYRYYLEVRTFDSWTEGDGRLDDPDSPYLERLKQLREVLDSIVSEAPSTGAETRLPFSAFHIDLHIPSGWHSLRLNAGDIFHSTALAAGSGWSPQRQIAPSTDAWNRFWQEVEAVGLSEWEEYYSFDQQRVEPNTPHWRIVIQRGDGKTIHCGGFGAYPADSDFKLKAEQAGSRFERLVAAIRELAAHQL